MNPALTATHPPIPRTLSAGVDDSAVMARIGAAVANDADMVALFDVSDHLVYANESYRQMFLQEHPGGAIHFADILRWGFRRGSGLKINCGDVEAFLRDILPRRQARRRRSLEADTVDGRWLWITETPQPDGGLLCHFSDITCLKQTEHRLSEAKAALAAQAEALTRSNQELEQFAHVASHDLLAPLRTISSFAELLLRRIDKGDKDGMREYGQIIHEGVGRMRALLTGLLRYSRLGSEALEHVPLPLLGVVSDALSNLDETLRARQATVEVGELPTVTGDPIQLTQLFQNLVDNAIKYNQSPAPRVSIEAQRSGDDWVIGVRDNGIGIEPKFSERIFQMFKRLHAEEEYSGFGLGLAICKKIVARHGGRIWLESAGAGQGSCFHFTLKAAESTNV